MTKLLVNDYVPARSLSAFRGFAALVACVFTFGLLVSQAGGQQTQESCGVTLPPTIVGTAGDDLLRGTPAEDVIAGLGGNDMIEGGAGDDIICGGDGNDMVNGNEGNDLLSGDGGDDTIIGGGASLDDFLSTDVAYFGGASTGVTASLATGTASGWGSDSLANIEGLAGSAFQDSLTGDEKPNFLAGGLGNDVLLGGAGPDLLTGAADDDVIVGGAGEDLVFYDFAPRAVRVNLATGNAIGYGTDTLRQIENVDGSRFADVLIGNGLRNWLSGLDGNDELAGGGAADRLDGQKGNDGLKGGSGNDRLDGGPGRDRGDGGPGRDDCKRLERKRRCS